MSVPSRSLTFPSLPPSTQWSCLFLFCVPTLFLIMSSFLSFWLPLPCPFRSLWSSLIVSTFSSLYLVTSFLSLFLVFVSPHNLAPFVLFGASFGDPSLSTTSTLEHIPSSAARPRPLVRQQSLQQPLTHQPPPGPNDPPATSQSLGQLHTGPVGGGHRGGPRGVRGSPAGAGASRYRSGGGARSRSNPGSFDHVMGQIRTRGMDVKSFL